MAAPYKVTALVSVYKAEEFLQGCLESLVGQTIFAQTEVIIIDACSPENEQTIAKAFTEKYANIRYIRTAERETLYASWNRGIGMAQGEYITNANADDRLAPHAFERLARELDTLPQVALVYAKYRITAQKNAHFDTAPIKRQLQWIPYDHINLLRRTEVGPQPMWRKSVHAEVGLFNASFTVAGDYDMWLRISEKYPLRFIAEELGLCLEYDNNLEAQNPQRSHDERYKVKQLALHRFMQDDFTSHVPLPTLFRRFSSKFSQILQCIQRGEHIADLSNIEFHFFAYALLMTKFGDIEGAFKIIPLFFSLITDSENMSHLYSMLLLMSSKALPEHIQQKYLSTPNTISTQSPLVTFIIPYCGKNNYLTQTLDSLQAQTHTHWQLILVHSCPQEEILILKKELTKKYNDTRICYLYEKEVSQIALLNKGIQRASGSFLCIVHAGEMLVPSYIQHALALLHNQPHMAWVSPQTLLIGKSNRFAWSEIFDFFQSLLQFPCAPATLFRQELWTDIQGFTEEAQGFEMWDFWVRAGEHGWQGVCTAQMACICQHQFIQEGDFHTISIQHKLAFLQQHPWWFQKQSQDTWRKTLAESSSVALPAQLLDAETVHKARLLYEDKQAFKDFVLQLKQGYISAL